MEKLLATLTHLWHTDTVTVTTRPRVLNTTPQPHNPLVARGAGITIQRQAKGVARRGRPVRLLGTRPNNFHKPVVVTRQVDVDLFAWAMRKLLLGLGVEVTVGLVQGKEATPPLQEGNDAAVAAMQHTGAGRKDVWA